MLETEVMRKMLDDRNLLLVSKRIGTSYTSLYKFAKGELKSMNHENMVKLNNYLKRGLENAHWCF